VEIFCIRAGSPARACATEISATQENIHSEISTFKLSSEHGDMSDVQLYLLEADSSNKTEAKGIATRTATKLQQRSLKLIDLVTSLEPHINDKDNGSIRANSVAYLADVITALPLKVLSVQERRLLCDFILGRLEGDTEGVGASARALIALEGLGKWDTPTAQKVLRAFLDNTHPLRQFKLQTE